MKWLQNIKSCWTRLLEIITSKKFMFWFVVLLLICSFFFGIFVSYSSIKTELAWKNYLNNSKEKLEKQTVENKVKYVMSLYNCDSLIIFETIMQTFDPELVAVTIGLESEYNPNAISPANARGLMQCLLIHFKPGEKWDDPKTNILVGSNYLKDLVDMFDGDKILALAAYNCGPNRVIKNGYKIPLNTKNNETGKYITKAEKMYGILNEKTMRQVN